MEPYQGHKLRIELTGDARESFNEATSHVPPNVKACTAQLYALIKRLADHGKLRSPEQMNNEDEGFYAIKARCGLRAYGWFHTHRRGVFVISHFIMKQHKKLKKRDKERMENNRKAYEEQ